MVYRLYVETVVCEGKTAWSYAFYNHQNFMVYKRFGQSEESDINKLNLIVSCTALSYFEGSIRRRYYDEHFSTRIDEDYVTLYTHYPKISEIAKKVKAEGENALNTIEDNKELWKALVPFFSQKTMIFENSEDETYIKIGQDLAQKAFEK